MSVLLSPHDVLMFSNVNLAELIGRLLITFITPPIASLPYKVDAGPFMISMRSTIELGMPDKPYTVDKLLTNGIPSMSTIVYGPSNPLM